MPRRLGVEADGATPEAAETNGLAILALFLSIVWLFGLGAIAGMVLGWRALREIRESEGRQEGRTFAILAIVVGAFGLTSVGLVLMIAVRSG